MSRLSWIVLGIAILIVVVVGLGLSGVIMPGAWKSPDLATAYNGLVPAQKLLRVPVSGIYPGGNANGLEPNMANPLKNDPDAVARGMQDFANFNCIGCHMPHGGGGMGPALMDDKWIYGSAPQNIYETIIEGRPNGMPAFGGKIPEQQIWQIAGYVRSMSGNLSRSASPGRSDEMQGAPAEQLMEKQPPVTTSESATEGTQP